MLWTVACVAIAVWWGVGSPARQLARLNPLSRPVDAVAAPVSALGATRPRLLAAGAAALLMWAVAGGLGWFVWPLCFAAAAATYSVVTRHERRQSRRERVMLQAGLPRALQFLAVCLAAGAPVRKAVADVAAVSDGPTAVLLAGVGAQTAIGVSDADAWRTLRSHPVWGPVARDLARSVDSGSAVVDMLRLHAVDAARAHRDQLTARARTVGVKSAAPLMCCFLPAFILIGVVPIIAGLIESVLGW